MFPVVSKYRTIIRSYARFPRVFFSMHIEVNTCPPSCTSVVRRFFHVDQSTKHSYCLVLHFFIGLFLMLINAETLPMSCTILFLGHSVALINVSKTPARSCTILLLRYVVPSGNVRTFPRSRTEFFLRCVSCFIKIQNNYTVICKICPGSVF